MRLYLRAIWLTFSVTLPATLLFYSMLTNLWPWTTSGWPLGLMVWGPGMYTLLFGVPLSIAHAWILKILPTRSVDGFWVCFHDATRSALVLLVQFG